MGAECSVPCSARGLDDAKMKSLAGNVNEKGPGDKQEDRWYARKGMKESKSNPKQRPPTGLVSKAESEPGFDSDPPFSPRSASDRDTHLHPPRIGVMDALSESLMTAMNPSAVITPRAVGQGRTTDKDTVRQNTPRGDNTPRGEKFGTSTEQSSREIRKSGRHEKSLAHAGNLYAAKNPLGSSQGSSENSSNAAYFNYIRSDQMQDGVPLSSSSDYYILAPAAATVATAPVKVFSLQVSEASRLQNHPAGHPSYPDITPPPRPFLPGKSESAQTASAQAVNAQVQRTGESGILRTRSPRLRIDELQFHGHVPSRTDSMTRPLASSEAPPLNIRYALPSSNELPPISNQVDEMRRLQEKLKQSEDRIGNLLKADERQPIFIQQIPSAPTVPLQQIHEQPYEPSEARYASHTETQVYGHRALSQPADQLHAAGGYTTYVLQKKNNFVDPANRLPSNLATYAAQATAPSQASPRQFLSSI